MENSNNKKNPKVTVLMSIYNGEKYLRQAVDSILSQTFKDFEFLIINDDSTDRTAEILQSYKDSRIRIINNDENIGLTRSLNKGLKMAKGKYIARMDADDISMPHRLEKEVKLLDQNKNIGLVGTYRLIIDEESKTLCELKPPTVEEKLKEKLLLENPFAHGSVMFRKKCIEKIGPYREEFKSAQDYDLWLRIAGFFGIAIIPEFLYKWRLNIKSISVAKKAQQDKYVSLAIELAKERKQLGKDSIQIFKEEGNRKALDRLLGDVEFRCKTNIAQSYNYCIPFLLAGNKYREAWKLLSKSFISNPFYKPTWILILRAITRNFSDSIF